MTITITLPKLFNLVKTINRIQKGSYDPLNIVQNNELFRIINLLDRNFLVHIFQQGNILKVKVLVGNLCETTQQKLFLTITKFLGLDDPLLSNDLGSDFIQYPKIDQSLALHGYCCSFEALVQLIIGQLLSGKAANSIRKKFIEYFGGYLIYNHNKYFSFPSANIIEKLSIEQIMSIGISRPKSKAIIELAHEFLQKNLEHRLNSTTNLQEADYELANLFGIGPWTRQWFSLQRLRYFNTIPSSDLIIRKSFSWLVGIPNLAPAKQINDFYSRYKYGGSFAYRIMHSYLNSLSV